MTSEAPGLEPAGPAQSRRPPWTGLTIRAVMVLGFGLTGGIWLFAWSYFNSQMYRLEEQSQRSERRRAVSEQEVERLRKEAERASQEALK